MNDLDTQSQIHLPKDQIADVENPFGYSLKKATINGEDIRNSIQQFSISADLFSPVVMCTLIMHDVNKVFDTGNFSGEEVLDLELVKKKMHKPTTLKFKMFIKSIPDFKKSTEAINVLDYTMVFISQAGYKSRLKNVSFALKGDKPLHDDIKQLCKDELDMDVKVKGMSNVKLKAAMPFRTPIQHVLWMVDKCWTIDDNEFFIYPDLTAENQSPVLESIDEMKNKQPSVNLTYSKVRRYDPLEDSQAYLEETYTKIISIDANLKLDKLKAYVGGAYGADVWTIDHGFNAIHQMNPNQTGHEFDWTELPEVTGYIDNLHQFLTVPIPLFRDYGSDGVGGMGGAAGIDDMGILPGASGDTGMGDFNGGTGTARSVRYNGKRAILYPDGTLKVGGTRAWRNNNPGNLGGEGRKYMEGLVKRKGASGYDAFSNDGYSSAWSGLIFNSVEEGRTAHANLLRKNYGNMTIHDMAYKYTKADNMNYYINSLAKGAGVDSNSVRIKDLSPQQLSNMIAAQERVEGIRAGTIIKGATINADGTASGGVVADPNAPPVKSPFNTDGTGPLMAQAAAGQGTAANPFTADLQKPYSVADAGTGVGGAANGVPGQQGTTPSLFGYDDYDTVPTLLSKRLAAVNKNRAEIRKSIFGCTVCGDISYNCGDVIRIKVPTTGEQDSQEENVDKTLSGDFIINQVVHSFIKGMHTTKLTLFKIKPYTGRA